MMIMSSLERYMPPQEAIESSKKENEVTPENEITPEEKKIAEKIVTVYHSEVDKKINTFLEAMKGNDLLRDEAGSDIGKFFAGYIVRHSDWYETVREKLLESISEDTARLLDEDDAAEYDRFNSLGHEMNAVMDAETGASFDSEEKKEKEIKRRTEIWKRIGALASSLGMGEVK